MRLPVKPVVPVVPVETLEIEKMSDFIFLRANGLNWLNGLKLLWS
jgi:hypothetical protein